MPQIHQSAQIVHNSHCCQSLEGRLHGFEYFCDNETTVQILQSGTSDSEFSQCLCEIIFHAAQFNFRICSVHISGVENQLSDLLSRIHLNPENEKEFHKLTADMKLERTQVQDTSLREYR